MDEKLKKPFAKLDSKIKEYLVISDKSRTKVKFDS